MPQNLTRTEFDKIKEMFKNCKKNEEEKRIPIAHLNYRGSISLWESSVHIFLVDEISRNDGTYEFRLSIPAKEFEKMDYRAFIKHINKKIWFETRFIWEWD